MPFITNRDQRIHYTVEGSGPLLVLQHGLLSSAVNWVQLGYAGALSDRFTVACVDSLGHGDSDKPSESDPYALQHRAADLVAVMDELGHARAHVLGYSMGGWISVGVAKYYPERLASLTIAGWDLVSGIRTVDAALGAPMTLDTLLANVRRMAPAFVEWITPEVEAGLGHCWAQIRNLEGSEEAVLGLKVPVLLWNGNEDAYHLPMRQFAERHDLAFLSTPGNHLTAVFQPAEPIAGISAFLDASTAQ